MLLTNTGVEISIFNGSLSGTGVSCDYYNGGDNLMSLHNNGGTSKVVRWLVAIPASSLGDVSLAYVANDVSTSKSLPGTSKIVGVVGDSSKLELFDSLTLLLDASINLAGNGKKLRHFKGFGFIIVVFGNASGLNKAQIFNQSANTGSGPVKEVLLPSVDPVAVAASLTTN